MFEYFPDNYVWSLATVSAVGLGGAISEIEEACHGMKDRINDPMDRVKHPFGHENRTDSGDEIGQQNDPPQ